MSIRPRLIISRGATAIFVIVVFTTISVAGGLFFWHLDSALGHNDQRGVQVTELMVAVNALLCLGLLYRTYRQPKP